MKTLRHFQRRLRWLNVPTVALIALLQRTPVVRGLIATEEFVLASPIGAVLKSAIATGASLGAVHSLAGATQLAITAASPFAATVGVPVTIGFSITGTLSEPETWTVSGTLPPGLMFQGGATGGTINGATLTLSGTPTTAGDYTLTLRATDTPTAQSTVNFSYTINVTGGGSTNTAPAITTQPQSQTVNVGANVMFTVAASGSPEPTYQWRKDGANLSGETATTLTLSNVQASGAGVYTVVATNAAGSATSNNAILTVNASGAGAPNTPSSAGAFASSATEVTVSWLAATSGTAATGYKLERAADEAFSAGVMSWDLGASTSYVDTSAVANTTYYYRVSAVNGGSASAPSAAMRVQMPAGVGGGRARFASIATRAYCSTGDRVPIGGFVIAGSAPKRVLIRAVGPSLAAQGLSAGELLADPVVELHRGSPVIAENDDWTTNANAGEITTVGAQIGATPLMDSDTRSAALLTTLEPGAYTFIVSGKNGSSGIVLLEVYDADLANEASGFAGIATRAYGEGGDRVPIGGFVVTGDGTKRVLVRAVGPTLTAQGLPQASVMGNPMIELHAGAPVIAINDNWAQNANAAAITTEGARIGAGALAGSDANSSAMLLKLRAGVYSFISKARDDGAGIVLIEVFDAD